MAFNKNTQFNRMRKPTKRVLIGETPEEEAARLDALGDRRPDDLADPPLLAQGDDLGLDDAPDHVVLRLVGDDAVEPGAGGDPQRRRDLLGPPFGDPDVEHLPLADQVVEGPVTLTPGWRLKSPRKGPKFVL